MIKRFSKIMLFCILFSVFCLPITSVIANEYSPTTDLSHSVLFKEIREQHVDGIINYNYDSNVMITTIADSSGRILVSESYNLSTGYILTTTSTEQEALIEITDEQGNISRQSFQKENIFIPEPRYVYDGWRYTGLAVPAGAIANLVNNSLFAVMSGVAGLFGVAVSVINSVIAYMGIGWSMGEMLARALDTDGNGWVALHTRARRAYRGGPVISYDHKTT